MKTFIHEGATETKDYPGVGKYVGSIDANGNRQSTDQKDPGIMTYTNGDKYTGFWNKDKATGLGVMTYANGDVYRGDWVDGKRQGKGKIQYSDGRIYNGTWDQDKKQRQGIMAYPDGSQYNGNWVDDKRNRQGAIRYENKDEYHGEWVDDKRKNGHGVMIYSNGDQYQGNLVDNKRNGEGVIVYINGDQYEGEWVDDKRQGEGQLFYHTTPIPDGTTPHHTYKGHWFQDKKQGEGGMHYPDNSKYMGHWHEDERHGEGVLYNHNNVVEYRGNWKNDKKHPTDTPTASSLSQMSISDLPSKVFDIENDNYSLRLSQIDGNQQDTPIVFLAGKDLYVFTANLIRKVLEDTTSILYDCVPNDQGDYETKKDVSYFNLRRLFTMDGLVPLKLLRKTLIPRKKVVAVQQRYHSVTNKINSIANNKTLQLSEKKKNIKELLLDNKLPPVIYTFVPTKKKLSRMMSKAVAASEPDSAVGGFHCQDQGGTQWTVYNIVQVRKGRKKTPKTLKKYSNSARSASRRSASKSSKGSKRSARKRSDIILAKSA